MTDNVMNLLTSAPLWLILCGLFLFTCGGWVWRLRRRGPSPQMIRDPAPDLIALSVIAGVGCIVIGIILSWPVLSAAQ
jgi:hypothetical protein